MTNKVSSDVPLVSFFLHVSHVVDEISNEEALELKKGLRSLFVL
jgi:hypothetical protein